MATGSKKYKNRGRGSRVGETMAKGYLPYNLDQRLLLPADMRD